MHSFAVAGDHDGATALLTILEADSNNMEPGTLCYGGYILACVKHHAWKDALNTFETMKANNIPSTAATNHGLLLSAYQEGGQARVEMVLQDILHNDQSKVNQTVCLFVLPMLLPQVGSFRDLRELQRNVREYGARTGNDTAAIELCRSLRIAEVEDQRQSSDPERADAAWKQVLKSILETWAAERQSNIP